MTIELVIFLSVAIWGGVQVFKHSVPSSYERTEKTVTSWVHERLDVVEAKIEELTGGAK
jgi:hypothetical protein